ncbi:MAG: FliO/MopB family protein [Verrucomicrobiota bacterium]
MISLAWRFALVAALACFPPPILHATGEPETPPVSHAGYISTDPSNTSATTNPSDPSLSPAAVATRPPAPDIDSIGRMLGYLTLFAALAGGAVYFLKFGLPLARKGAAAERRLNILETRPLGNRQYLLVVAYDDTRMLLGVTPGKIDYLCPLDSSSPPPDFGKIMSSAEIKSTPS